MKILFAISALLISGCAPAGEQPDPAASAASLGMLDIVIGDAYPQFDGVASETSFGGFVVMGAPLVGRPLSGTFYDYSVQVDASSKKVIAVSARRVFASLQECQKHFDSTLILLKSRYPFDSQTAVGPASLEAVSGPLKIQSLCSFDGGAIHPTLSISVANRSLAIEAYQRARQRDGR